MDDPKVSYQEMQGKQVWEQSSTGAIALDNVKVPEEAILGEEHEGFKVMVTTLNGGRLFIAALSLASLAFALDTCRTYAQERIQFEGQPIGRFQRVQDVLLDMDITLEQGLTWLIHLVTQYDDATLKRESAAKVKIECSRQTSDLLTRAMEISLRIPGKVTCQNCRNSLAPSILAASYNSSSIRCTPAMNSTMQKPYCTQVPTAPTAGSAS